MATFTTVEMYSTDAAASAAFMADVFQHPSTLYGDSYYDVHVGDGFTVAFQTNPEPPPPLAIFRVDDLGKMRETVIAAGGVITVEPFDFPGGRRFQFREPGGNELSVWTPTVDR
ncbi:VOC family protein [Corynebacterium sp.]|uniref:VOC family protein n=1 Tax=Corynebacterium sp. TaxID=1720 RepID=UPI0025C0EDE2|nr:VOC family protein [Corynebacterium sp.]